VRERGEEGEVALEVSSIDEFMRISDTKTPFVIRIKLSLMSLMSLRYRIVELTHVASLMLHFEFSKRSE